jgi:hypothetical protein
VPNSTLVIPAWPGRVGAGKQPGDPRTAAGETWMVPEKMAACRPPSIDLGFTIEANLPELRK